MAWEQEAAEEAALMVGLQLRGFLLPGGLSGVESVPGTISGTAVEASVAGWGRSPVFAMRPTSSSVGSAWLLSSPVVDEFECSLASFQSSSELWPRRR